MHRMYPIRQLLPVALAAALFGTGAAALAGTRHYEARCQAQDGTEFHLRAEYKTRHITLGQFAKVYDVQNWKIAVRAKPGANREVKAPATIRFVPGQPPDCSEVGALDGIPVVSQSFLQDDGSWYQANRIPLALRPHSGDLHLKAPLRQQLEQLDVSVREGFALLLPRKGRLVYERPLFSRALSASGTAHVGAVLRSVSTDNGDTWSDPVYTTEAELYALGKPAAAQPFAARLISHNMLAR